MVIKGKRLYYFPSNVKAVVKLPRYSKHGKKFIPITQKEFEKRLSRGHFVLELHKAFCAALFYYGVRRGELLRAVKEQFTEKNNRLYFEVGKRLKGGMTTEPLGVNLAAPFAYNIFEAVENAEPKKKVFPFSERTAYNIVDRAFDSYPHHFRLSRITLFLEKGAPLIKVKSWTGHQSLQSLNSYAGRVDIDELTELIGGSTKQIKRR